MAKTTTLSSVSICLAVLLLPLVLYQHQPVDSMSTGINTKPGVSLEIAPHLPTLPINLKKPNATTITCQSNGAPPGSFDSLKWTGPHRTDNAEELKSRHLVTQPKKGNNVLRLNFREPTNADSGIYYCFGTFQGGDKLNASIGVMFFSPIEISLCASRQLLTKGSDKGKVSCHVVGEELKLSISKDGQSIDDFNGRYKWDNDGLVIDGVVGEHDAGQYLIEGHSLRSGDSIAQTIDVEVQTMPEFLPYSESATGETEFHGVEGEPVQLDCKATGYPQPLVTWLDPTKRNLTDVGGYTIAKEKGILTIHKVDKKFDQGLFECKAYNSVGSIVRNVSMTVDTRPLIVGFDNKTVDEGSEVTFECRSTGEPEPKFSIRRQGINQIPYMNGDGLFRRVEVIPEAGNPNVYVHKLTMAANRTHFGLHYCNATNRAGTAERYNHLFVNYKPDLSQTSAIQYVKMGKSVVVSCHISAYPKPQVTWWIDRTQQLNVDSTFETGVDYQSHVIKMTPPSQQQVAFSTFTCKAENHMGITTQDIKAQYTMTPGLVSTRLVKRTPTTVELSLSVPNDGGDRIRKFIYSLYGTTMDNHNPTFNYRVDSHQGVELFATSRDVDVYTIKNLLPYYAYRMTIRAVNDVGDGDNTEVRFETPKPTKPEPPIIDKPKSLLSQHSTPGFPSDYNNGYTLKWFPPELDNGDPVTKYTIKYYSYDTTASSDGNSQVVPQKTLEQLSDRPMKTILGPLETGRRYKIELRAINKYEDSEPASIIIYTKPDSPVAQEFASHALAWLIEPSTSALLAMLAFGLVLLVVIDLFFCFFGQIGMSFKIHTWCCPPKTDSVDNVRGEKFEQH